MDFCQIFQGKTAYEVLQGVVQGYVNMNHQEKLLTFYKVIYSERSIQPMAARIVAEETERMIIATKQLFYAMVIHKLLHFENADMSAVSFAMASRQGRMKKVLYARQDLVIVARGISMIRPIYIPCLQSRRQPVQLIYCPT